MAVNVTDWPETEAGRGGRRGSQVGRGFRRIDDLRRFAAFAQETCIAAVGDLDRVRGYRHGRHRVGRLARCSQRDRAETGGASQKVTVPPGTPAPGALALAIAVNVTAWPKTEGAAAGADRDRRGILLDGLGQAAAAGQEFRIAAVGDRDRVRPTTSFEVLKVACPLAFSVPVPSVVAPSLKVTDPVGVPSPEMAATTAVKVTDWPKTEGAAEVVTVTSLVHRPTCSLRPLVLGLNVALPL